MQSYIIADDYFIGAGRLLSPGILQVITKTEVLCFTLLELPDIFADKEGIDICVIGTFNNNNIIVEYASFIDIAAMIELDEDKHPYKRVFILPPDDLSLTFNGKDSEKKGISIIDGQTFNFLISGKYNGNKQLFPIFLEVSTSIDITNTIIHKIIQLN